VLINSSALAPPPPPFFFLFFFFCCYWLVCITCVSLLFAVFLLLCLLARQAHAISLDAKAAAPTIGDPVLPEISAVLSPSSSAAISGLSSDAWRGLDYRRGGIGFVPFLRTVFNAHEIPHLDYFFTTVYNTKDRVEFNHKQAIFKKTMFSLCFSCRFASNLMFVLHRGGTGLLANYLGLRVHVDAVGSLIRRQHILVFHPMRMRYQWQQVAPAAFPAGAPGGAGTPGAAGGWTTTVLVHRNDMESLGNAPAGTGAPQEAKQSLGAPEPTPVSVALVEAEVHAQTVTAVGRLYRQQRRWEWGAHPRDRFTALWARPELSPAPLAL
jgi:hypothetical protein